MPPSGETSLLAMLLSLGIYVITITISKFASFSELTIGFFINLTLWGLGIIILIGIISGLVSFLDNKISKRTEIKTETEVQRGTNRKLSIGVYIWSILYVVLGILWIISFLLNPLIAYKASIGYFISGILYLIGGVGMLKRKYWALRFTQVYLILLTILCVVVIPIVAYEAKKIDLVGALFALLVFLIYFILPLWFLFKKSTVDQFK